MSEMEIEQLEKAIAALEAQRGLLGEAVVNAAAGPLRQKLAALQAPGRADAGRQAGEDLHTYRRSVTVLFADMVGFSTLAETLDPEDTRDLIEAYFARWTVIINRYGGRVEKFIGDAVMAVFGLEQAREDDPENALRAALALRDSQQAFNQELARQNRPGLEVRVGVHTGLVIASLHNRTVAAGVRSGSLYSGPPRSDGQDFSIMGDTVNLASRLQTAAPPGGVLISHDTYRLVRGLFNTRSLPPLTVKGKSEPLQTYLALNVKPRALQIERFELEGIETRLVGRDPAMQFLQQALLSISTRPGMQVITLVGEAGLGKSRLVAEFEKWGELLPEVYRYVKARATPAMQNLPYGLLRDLLSYRLQIQDNDSPAGVRQKLEQGMYEAWQRLHPAVEGKSAREESAAAAHFIGQLAGFNLGDSPYLRSLHDDARQFRFRALNYLADYIRSLAASRPLVLVFEDLHWADDNSLQALAELFAALDGTPALVLCTARPGLIERHPGWEVTLTLPALDDAGSRALVKDILRFVEHVPEALVDMLVATAGGNPFYIEELIKVLIEDGVIERSAERWRILTERMDKLRLPPTLVGVLQARFDSLSPTERLVLQRAAVVGRTFWDQAVLHLSHPGDDAAAGEAHTGAVYQTSDARLLAAIEKLRARNLIVVQAPSIFAGARQYQFQHTLFYEVTYESVLKRQRRIYHAGAAHWLERIASRGERADEIAGSIALHYDQAGEELPAAAWYRRAAHFAAAHFAHASAARDASRALELLAGRDEEARFDLFSLRERVLDMLGDRPAQARDLETLAELAATAQHDARLAEALVRQAGFYNNTGEYLQSTALAEQGIAKAQALGACDLAARGYTILGGAQWHQGNLAAARQAYQHGQAEAIQARQPKLEADNLRGLGIVCSLLNEFPAAQAYFEQALHIYEKIGDRRGEGMTLNSLGAAASDQGLFSLSRGYFDRSQAIKQAIGDRLGAGITLSNLAIVARGQEDYLAARQYAQQCLDITRKIDDLEGVAVILNILGNTSLALGDRPAAEDYLEQALQISRQIGDRINEVEVLLNLADVRLVESRPQDALALLENAGALAEEMETPREISSVLAFRGRALLAVQRYDAASECFARSRMLRLEAGLENLAAEALAGLVDLALAQDDLAALTARLPELLAYLGDPLTGWQRLAGVNDPYAIYTTAWRAAQRLNDPRAREILSAAHTHLQEIAVRLAQPEQRAFLENHPGHRAIVEAFISQPAASW